SINIFVNLFYSVQNNELHYIVVIKLLPRSFLYDNIYYVLLNIVSGDKNTVSKMLYKARGK
ncbi:hypothetical protein DOS58_02520, partial [Staphylococcus felis]